MKKTTLLHIFSSILILITIFSYQNIVFAQGNPSPTGPGSANPIPTGPGSSNPNPTGPGSVNPSPTGPGSTNISPKLESPFKPSAGVTNLCDLINKILNYIAEIGAIIGVLFIIWSGFLFISAQGNPEKINAAKSTFKTTIIGLAILLGANVIAKVIFSTVSSITSSFEGGVSICSAGSDNNNGNGCLWGTDAVGNCLPEPQP